MSRNWHILIAHVDSFDLPLDEGRGFLTTIANPYNIRGDLTQISDHDRKVLLTLAKERRACVRNKKERDSFTEFL